MATDIPVLNAALSLLNFKTLQKEKCLWNN